MITIYIGDLLITQTTHQSLDPDDEIQFHHLIHFRDVPTGRTAEIHCATETEAISIIAAWLMADDEPEQIAKLFEAAMIRLYHDLPKDNKGHQIFLP